MDEATSPAAAASPPSEPSPAAAVALEVERGGRRDPVRRRPLGDVPPAPGQFGRELGRAGRLHDVEREHRLVVAAGRRLALQPAVPPATHQAHAVDRRAGRARVRPGMTPRPDHAAPRRLDVLQHREHGLAIGVVEAADGEDRRLDRGPVLADRGRPPEGVATLMAEPLQRPLRGGLETSEPFLAPARPEALGVRRQRVLADHLDRPVDALAGVERPARRSGRRSRSGRG